MKRDYEQDWLEFIDKQYMAFRGNDYVVRDTINHAIEFNRFSLEAAIEKVEDEKLKEDIMEKHLALDLSIEALDVLSIMNIPRASWISEEKRKDEFKSKTPLFGK